MPTPRAASPLRARLRAAAVLVAPALVAACAGVARIDGPPMEPGRYSFDGSGQVSHHLHDRQYTSVVHVSGVMDVSDNGDIDIMGAGANCSRRGSGTLPARVSIACGSLNLNIGPGGGNARMRTSQSYSQNDGCAEFELDAQGRPTGRCIRVNWRERQRSIVVNIPLAVVRTSGGE